MKISNLSLFDKNTFGDSRLANRGNYIINALINTGTSVINRMFVGWDSKMAAFRFLANPKVSKAKIKRSMKYSCIENIKLTDEHILVIQDTSEFNFGNHKERIKKTTRKPGQVNNNDPGFFMHTAIAIGAESHTMYGIPHLFTYNWHPDRIRKKDFNKISRTKPLNERDSHKWISTAWHSMNSIAPTNSVTMIGDRESDIYDLLALKRKPNVNILTRITHNRCLADSELKLFEMIEQSPVSGVYEFKLPSRGHGHKARIVKMELRYEKVKLNRPFQGKGIAVCKQSADQVELYCVYAKECGKIPNGENPISWKLYTTHIVDSVEMAKQCVEWYRTRWFIEEVFRVMKSQGLGIEESQLEDIESLQKLAFLALVAATKIVALKMAFDIQDEDAKALQYFSEEEMSILKKKILPKLEGKTQILKNPYKSNSLLWCAWILARLGGWSGYISQSKPGYITFKRGYDIFYTITSFI